MMNLGEAPTLLMQRQACTFVGKIHASLDFFRMFLWTSVTEIIKKKAAYLFLERDRQPPFLDKHERTLLTQTNALEQE